MIRRGFKALLPAFAAAASLFTGLVPTLLGYGRFEPLDWLLPGFAALAAMRLALGAGYMRAVGHWTLVAWPPALVVSLAASVVPWPGLVLTTAALATGAFALAMARRRSWLVVLVGTALMAAIRMAAWTADEGMVSATLAGRVAVMTALPLFQQEGSRGDVLDGVGERAPIIRGLDADWTVGPIDMLDAATLHGVDRLLLAQPRLLAPTELVALDNWVRWGGKVTILADPLLRWPNGYPLGDARRPPVTSLLDPLMTHWGLTLEYAVMLPSDRRVLASGAMIELAGASRFTAAQGAPCSLAERGLIAYCRVGKGSAVLIADSDWIDDRLWTVDPAHPRDARSWTSDALSVLAQIIAHNESPLSASGAWLISQAALISALRWALGLIVLLAVALDRFGAAPKSPQDSGVDIDRDSKSLAQDST